MLYRTVFFFFFFLLLVGHVKGIENDESDTSDVDMLDAAVDDTTATFKPFRHCRNGELKLCELDVARGQTICHVISPKHKVQRKPGTRHNPTEPPCYRIVGHYYTMMKVPRRLLLQPQLR
jgi:hypothetical protein